MTKTTTIHAAVPASANDAPAAPTYGPDFLYGSDVAETLHGLWGDDYLSGQGGDDKVYGDQGDDTLSGDEGNDKLYGGSGGDRLEGGAGADVMNGDAGDDTISIYSHADATGDTVNGGTGVDTLSVLLDVESTKITFAANDPDVTNSFMGWFTLTGIEKYDISGGSGDDTITGYALADYLSGGDGRDTLTGGGGADVIDGGTGKDTLTGNDGDDNINGGTSDDHIYGNQGDDTLIGDDGNDTIDGSAGDDTIAGGAGADTLIGYDGNDTISSDGTYADIGTEKDNVNAGRGDDYVLIGVTDYADGGDGTDTVHLDFSAATKAETFTFSAGDIKFAGGGEIKNFEILEYQGGKAVDTVTGGANGDHLMGGDNNDLLTGAAGDDTLDGEAGNDTLHGGDGSDVLTDSAGADKIYGDSGADTIKITTYDAASDTFDGGGGSDRVDFSGDYTIGVAINLSDQSKNDGIAKGDTFAGIEHWTGSAKDDSFIGAGSGDDFNGGYGDDVLIGNDGDDHLAGGDGSDTLTGGAGKDTFDLADFTGEDSWKGDVITDFKHGDDHIKVTLYELGFAQAADFHLINASSPDVTGPTLFFDAGSHRLWFDADGKGGDHSPVLIATLNNVTHLDASDFTFG